MRSRRRRNPQSGFTLPECLLACVLLVGMSLAVGQALVAGQQQTQEAINVERAMDLANEMMQRIAAMPYSDSAGVQNPGPEPGERSPQDFDNMDDFHGLAESAKEIRDSAGALYPSEYQMFTRRVSASYGNVSAPALGTVSGLTVTVSVSDGKQTWTLTRFMPAAL